jgi:hypothetical protein
MSPELIEELMTVYREYAAQMIQEQTAMLALINQDTELTRILRSEMSGLLKLRRTPYVQDHIERLQSKIDCTQQSNDRQKRYKKLKLRTARVNGMLHRMNKELKES